MYSLAVYTQLIKMLGDISKYDTRMTEHCGEFAIETTKHQICSLHAYIILSMHVLSYLGISQDVYWSFDVASKLSAQSHNELPTVFPSWTWPRYLYVYLWVPHASCPRTPCSCTEVDPNHWMSVRELLAVHVCVCVRVCVCESVCSVSS